MIKNILKQIKENIFGFKMPVTKPDIYKRPTGETITYPDGSQYRIHTITNHNGKIIAERWYRIK